MERSVEQRLLDWAGRAAPREACGLLFGQRAGEMGSIEDAVLCADTALEPDRFVIPPQDLLEHGDNPRWIGVWHAHPLGPPALSLRDRRGAEAWPRLMHLLVVPPSQLLLFASAAEGLTPLSVAAR